MPLQHRSLVIFGIYIYNFMHKIDCHSKGRSDINEYHEVLVICKIFVTIMRTTEKILGQHFAFVLNL